MSENGIMNGRGMEEEWKRNGRGMEDLFLLGISLHRDAFGI